MAELSSLKVEWDDMDRPVITVEYADSEAFSTEAAPDEFLKELAKQLPDKSARFLRRLIDLNESTGAVSLAQLADDLKVEKKEVDGWNRNLGRSIKRNVRELGFLRHDEEDGTAQLFEFVWDNDNNQWLYSVPASFRVTLAAALDAR